MAVSCAVPQIVAGSGVKATLNGIEIRWTAPLRPDFVMPPLVLGFKTRFQLHLEGNALHPLGSFVLGVRDQGCGLLATDC